VSAWAGHADLSFTKRTYVHPNAEHLREASDALARLLGWHRLEQDPQLDVRNGEMSGPRNGQGPGLTRVKPGPDLGFR
jgi:hypothetical protein